MPARVWVLSELFPPEETSTGYFMSRIAHGLSARWPVRVLCAQPTYAQRGTRAPRTERIGRLDIQRCTGTTLNKDVLPFKVLIAVTFSVSLTWHLLIGLRKSDAVLVVTNPPILPLFAAMVCALRSVPCVLFVHDVYPDVVVVTGFLRPGSLVNRVARRLMRAVYGQMSHIVAVGHDMEAHLGSQLPVEQRNKLTTITLWADSDVVRPEPREANALLAAHNLQDVFVLQYAGNMGYPNDLATIVAAAEALQDDPHVRFMFIGSGARRAWLQAVIGPLSNCLLLSPRGRDQQNDFLNACDVALISLVPGMAGLGVPSRLYNILAAGKPIIAICDSHSEIAVVVREADVGWVVAPGDAVTLVQAIRAATLDAERRAVMGRRARALAESRFTLERTLRGFETIFASCDRNTPAENTVVS